MMHHMKAKDEHIADMTHNLANLAYERTRLEAELDDIQHSGWYRAARGFRLYRPRCFVTREVETPFVSIILVNYNGKHFLEDCLCSIQKQTYPANRFEIILVDNASRDGSAAFVRERFPQVQLIENKSNVGYASGNNLGFRKAKGNLIALLNNDTVVEPQWLEALVDAILLDPRVGAVSSKIYFKNRPGIINNAGLCLLPDGSGCDRGFHAPDQGQFNSPTEVFGACGAGMLMRRELFDDVGGFDDRLFMYYEDLDLAWRARIRGWRARFEPHSVVHHVHCGSSVEWSPFFLFYVERNRVLVNIKNAPAKQALRVFASFCYRALRKWALVLTWREQSERDRGHALSYLKACFSLAWGLPGALWKRLKIRYWRRITPDTAFAHLIGPNI
jgi:GT2 family glycosyltransferase